MKNSNETYYNTVIVDSETDKIVGAATLIKERKFIHKCANVRLLLLNFLHFFKYIFNIVELRFLFHNFQRGIIEEVIISDQYRGKSLGKL